MTASCFRGWASIVDWDRYMYMVFLSHHSDSVIEFYFTCTLFNYLDIFYVFLSV